MKNILKLFLSAVLVAGAFAACMPENKELELIANKKLITSDGVDNVKFTVLYEGREVTGAVIKSGDATLEGDSFTTIEAKDHTFRAMYNDMTSNELTIRALSAADRIQLCPDKNEVVADGVDKVTFKVIFDGQEVDGTVICCDNPYFPADSFLENNTFTTTELGIHKFMAAYNGTDSDEYFITALPVPGRLYLIVDKSAIQADGIEEVRFTVRLNGIDVTPYSRICDSKGVFLKSPVFATYIGGEYRFRAIYNLDKTGLTEDIVESDYVTIDVRQAEHTLDLYAHKLAPLGDGVVEAHFTVSLDGKVVVTEHSKIFGPDGEVLPSPIFTTPTYGEYRFYATYNLDPTGLTEEHVLRSYDCIINVLHEPQNIGVD